MTRPETTGIYTESTTERTENTKILSVFSVKISVISV